MARSRLIWPRERRSLVGIRQLKWPRGFLRIFVLCPPTLEVWVLFCCIKLYLLIWLRCRSCRVWTTSTANVKSSTPTSNQRTSWCAWTTPSWGVWPWRRQNGRKLELHLHLDQQVDAQRSQVSLSFEWKLTSASSFPAEKIWHLKIAFL